MAETLNQPVLPAAATPDNRKSAKDLEEEILALKQMLEALEQSEHEQSLQAH
jgi:hypothetical protein